MKPDNSRFNCFNVIDYCHGTNRFSLVHPLWNCIVCVKGSLILYEERNKVLITIIICTYVGRNMYVSVNGIVVYA